MCEVDFSSTVRILRFLSRSPDKGDVRMFRYVDSQQRLVLAQCTRHDSSQGELDSRACYVEKVIALHWRRERSHSEKVEIRTRVGPMRTVVS
jgi:hypothetical protein